MLDLVIRGGDVVTPQGVGRWDVAIEGERIVALGLPEHGLQAGRVIDASGKIVVPGGVEPHTHLAHFISMQPEENLSTLGPEEDTRGMVFGGKTTHVDFGRIQLAMEKVAPHNGIMVVHAEDHDIVQFMYEKFREEKQTDGWLLPLVHNKLSEKLAFRRTIQLAAHTGAGVYFVHTSAREGVEAVVEARAGGYPIYAETLHHYACFTAEDYKSPRGFCYHTYPSLKYPEDQAALWNGLVRDGVSTTATDEFPTSLELKLRGQDLENVTGGNLGAEARMGIVYSEGVVKRRMSLARFADVTATNAAKILGLYPKKGVIAPGSDADLVLIDPAIRKTLAREDFHVSDYSPWEGWPIQGWPVTTILRGRVVVEGGRLVSDLRDGRLVRRRIAPEVLRRPAC